MDPTICEEASYDTAYDVSDHSNSTDVNVPSLSEHDTQHVDKLLDHTKISIKEIPYVGLRFVLLEWAQEFYSNYAKKVGFVTRIRNTTFDKTRKESRISINQSIHCSREGYQES
ncbi:hypothetical protein AHAS_Ahas15G0253700 [Arachis hypogaea]|uniref:FAR1 domain-containing protein n=1 Tax=Arachis hypogaea TaxID=3818 RepID=A0A444Z3H1_ARAHY|nr:hypothetical protein Ahy_B05g076531 [Arachis hypogaea]